MPTSRQRPAFWFLLPFAALFVISCREPDAPLGVAAPQAAGDTRALTQFLDTTEVGVVPRYEVRLTAAGSFRIGEPVSLRATIKAQGSVKESEIAIALPELARM